MINARQWSGQQRAIFHEAAHGVGHFAVRARAGTGKTTTSVAMLDHLPAETAALFTSFASRNVAELEARIAGRATAKTLHGLGLGMVSRACRDVVVDKKGEKSRLCAARALSALSIPADDDWIAIVVRVASFAKNTLAESREDLEDIIDALGLDDPDHPIEQILEATLGALQWAVEDTSVIDFDDMLWLPIRYQLHSRYVYDFVVVDEVQDMNRAQLWIAQRVLAEGGRMVVVGDDRQAIYGWRGADANAFGHMLGVLGAECLPLTYTYRCPRRVVELAQAIVPDYECTPDAPDGILRDAKSKELLAEAQPGDFVLSRFNAALVPIALRLVRAGKRACVVGRDLASPLYRLIRKSKAKSCDELAQWLEQYVAEERARLESKPARLEALVDTCSVLDELNDEVDTIGELRDTIDRLFVEDNAKTDLTNTIACSTVHKAKGLERDRVWLLADTLKSDSREEDNIRYVAMTRAKRELVFVR